MKTITKTVTIHEATFIRPDVNNMTVEVREVIRFFEKPTVKHLNRLCEQMGMIIAGISTREEEVSLTIEEFYNAATCKEDK